MIGSTFGAAPTWFAAKLLDWRAGHRSAQPRREQGALQGVGIALGAEAAMISAVGPSDLTADAPFWRDF